MPSITLQKSNQLKSIAILMMLCIHLFNRDYVNLFTPIIFIGGQPLSYYVSLFCDACVPIFAFVSGYGLYFKYQQNQERYTSDNLVRLKKLYINYWVILLIFAIGLGYFLQIKGYPGSIQKVILNITGLEPSYNSAWWFFTTYVFFVLTSSFWFRLLDKVNPYVFIISLLIVYAVAFYFRVYKNHIFSNDILTWIHTQSALYFCTLFQFMLGAFTLKFNWNTKVGQLFKNIKLKNYLIILMMIGLVVFHGLVPNFIVAPFTAIAFIFLYLQLDLPKIGDRLLDFFTPHATNIWLIHMFFYMIYFKDFVYSFQYVPVIYFVLLIMCVASSYLVNYIIHKISRVII